MAAVEVFVWEPYVGRMGDLIASCQKAKAIHAKQGVDVQLASTRTGNVLYSARYEDWEAWAKAQTETQGNADWQAFWAEATADPTAKLINVEMLQTID